ncbi:MAG: DUF1848 family protein [Candidatus Lokiarchaeota archaeon]|nr:DUF1848 family protein [Candidatus Lokiarchaeota archaeon]
MDDKSNSIGKIIQSPIISCSRRTDIPAFLMDWVLEKIQIGHVDVVNPFNRKQISRISLKNKDVKCWVWWSKDFAKWISEYEKHPHLFKSYKGHYFQFTINSPSDLEQNLQISLEERFSQLDWLINEFGLNAISFRFDPIILYKKDDEKRIRGNLNKFEYIIENVSRLGMKEMTFSFATIYSKVNTRMQKRGYIAVDPPLKKKKEILSSLLEICNKNNIQMEACCQPDLIDVKEIKQAHCIDTNKIEQLVGEKIQKIKDTGQRKGCGCYKSKDIGGYSGMFRCRHNCAYCYASPAKN